jgi:glycerol-3-phosphate acyltransferase PlsX
MRIIIDTLGCDNPNKLIDGTMDAMREDATLLVTIFGDAEVISIAAKAAGVENRTHVIHCTDAIECGDKPTDAIKNQTNSSMVQALNLLKTDESYSAVVSAGSTGALLTGAFLKLGRIPGVSRPALCPLICTKVNGVQFGLTDAGANMDCRPMHLAHFALMADIYQRAMGVAKPRVALLNVGTESAKGNELTRASHEILSKLPINYVGVMEARDVFSGDYDVIVTDGFAGNILLKTAEGAMSFIGSKIREVCHDGIVGKLGGLLLRKKLARMKRQVSEETAGGTPVLGIKKLVVKAHGNSGAYAFKCAIQVAARCAAANMAASIEKAMADNAHLIEVQE